MPWSAADDFFMAIANEAPRAHYSTWAAAPADWRLASQTLVTQSQASTPYQPPGGSASETRLAARDLDRGDVDDPAVGDIRRRSQTSHVAQLFVTTSGSGPSRTCVGRSGRPWRSTVVTPAPASGSAGTPTGPVTWVVARGGAELPSRAAGSWRTEGELRSSLHDAGLPVERIYGGWKRQSVGDGDGELLVIARA